MQYTPWLRWSWDETHPASHGPKKSLPTDLTLHGSLSPDPLVSSRHLFAEVFWKTVTSSTPIPCHALPCLAPHGFGVLLRSIRRFLAPTHPRIDYPSIPHSRPIPASPLRIVSASADQVPTGSEPKERKTKRPACDLFASFSNSVYAGTCG